MPAVTSMVELVEPQRTYVVGSVLVCEYRVVNGPRKGSILTTRTKMDLR